MVPDNPDECGIVEGTGEGHAHNIWMAVCGGAEHSVFDVAELYAVAHVQRFPFTPKQMSKGTPLVSSIHRRLPILIGVHDPRIISYLITDT